VSARRFNPASRESGSCTGRLLSGYRRPDGFGNRVLFYGRCGARHLRFHGMPTAGSLIWPICSC